MDVIHPSTGEVLIEEGQEITEDMAQLVEESPIEMVEIRSPLTCETKKGICAKCYGRNLATGGKIQKGESVGVIAAQSIGEPGTQLTLRTFHVGGTASNIAEESTINAKHDGIIEIDELRTVKGDDGNGNTVDIVIGRTAEMRLLDSKTGNVLSTGNVPYGAIMKVTNGEKVAKGDVICEWDPYNAVIISESAGTIKYEHLEEGITYRVEIDEQTGFREKVVSEMRDKKKIPTIKIMSSKNEMIKSYNLPVGAHITVDEGDKIKAGKVLVKIPRKSAKSGDITGGLPRVTELFEARNPSNPAVISEIDGIVSYGKIKRGNREIIVESRSGEKKKYLVSLSKQILVQENDYVKAGMALSDGSVTPADILSIQGTTQVQEYLVNEIQEVYRLQGVKINDKHFEVIVRQMMRKVRITDSGDTRFLENQLVHKNDFMEENDKIFQMKVVVDAGESERVKAGQIMSPRQLRDENSILKRNDQKLIETRDALPAVAEPVLQGITRASLQTKSFISAASFQETTKILNEAAVSAKEDYLEGLKENVIVGHKIPAGTGMRDWDNLIVGSMDDYEELKEKKTEKVEA